MSGPNEPTHFLRYTRLEDGALVTLSIVGATSAAAAAARLLRGGVHPVGLVEVWKVEEGPQRFALELAEQDGPAAG